jgi:hypothetical protein
MSAVLLRSADHVHELADDRESAFWVLTWVLLRYTQHNLSPDDLAERMTIFDQTLWIHGTVSGGTLKTLALFEKTDLSEVQFTGRPGLRKLINSLAHTFSFRYKRKPSEEASDRNMNRVGISSFSVLDSISEEQLAALKGDPQWLVRTLRDATSNGDWPTNDGPVKQKVGSIWLGSRKYQGNGVS